MKPLRLLLPLLALLLMAGNAFAWNCSDPLASRVDVGTTQPSGSSGNGDGQWFKGTGSEGTSGHYYVCQVPKPPTDPKGGKGGSKSTSSSSSSSSATGGNSSSTATGGNSSSKSGVSNSGNSSNTNTNTANGGAGGAGGQGGSASATGGSVSGSGNSTQGQKQGQSQSSSNDNQSSASASNNGNGNGNGSNNASFSSETNVAAPKIPVSTAYAPTTLPTSPCTKGFGGGIQTMPVGGSFGMSTVDKNCVILEAARNAPNILTFCKVYITHKAVKAAGVTLDDCMKSYAIPEPVVREVIKEVPVVREVVKEVPVEVVKVVPAPVPAFQNQLVGICTFASQFSCDLKTKAPGNPLHVTRICDDMLHQAVVLQQQNPGTVIKLIGNENASERLSSSMYALARAKNVQRRLVGLGAKPTSIAVETGKTGDRTVEVWVVSVK